MEVRFVVGNLTKMEVEAIVNPANSEGEMGGGVAAAIKRAGGKQIEFEAMERAPIPIGRTVVTSAGKMPCEYVVHAPTMKMPLQRTDADKIRKAMKAALQVASELEIKSLAVPGMGTGTGKVPKEEAARAMVEVAKKYDGTTLQELTFVDLDQEMVQALEACWFPTPAGEEDKGGAA